VKLIVPKMKSIGVEYTNKSYFITVISAYRTSHCT